MERIVVDLPDEDIRQLDNLKLIHDIPRAEIIRRAIEGYLRSNNASTNKNAFGLWKNQNDDGVEYQHSLREEWE